MQNAPRMRESRQSNISYQSMTHELTEDRHYMTNFSAGKDINTGRTQMAKIDTSNF